jgi:hypothetical protein
VVTAPCPPGEREREVLEAFLQAWHACDIPALAALLRDDVVLSMPPQAIRILGRDQVAGFFATVPADGRLDLILRVPITYATCWYSWRMPPAWSRLRMRKVSRPAAFSCRGRSGAAWPTARATAVDPDMTGKCAGGLRPAGVRRRTVRADRRRVW